VTELRSQKVKDKGHQVD